MVSEAELGIQDVVDVAVGERRQAGQQRRGCALHDAAGLRYPAHVTAEGKRAGCSDSTSMRIVVSGGNTSGRRRAPPLPDRRGPEVHADHHQPGLPHVGIVTGQAIQAGGTGVGPGEAHLVALGLQLGHKLRRHAASLRAPGMHDESEAVHSVRLGDHRSLRGPARPPLREGLRLSGMSLWRSGTGIRHPGTPRGETRGGNLLAGGVLEDRHGGTLRHVGGCGQAEQGTSSEPFGGR